MSKLPQLNMHTDHLEPVQDTGLFLGLGAAAMVGRVAVCVMPELAEHFGAELAKGASISKGRVKAHELRQQLNGMHSKKDGKAADEHLLVRSPGPGRPGGNFFVGHLCSDMPFEQELFTFSSPFLPNEAGRAPSGCSLSVKRRACRNAH